MPVHHALKYHMSKSHVNGIVNTGMELNGKTERVMQGLNASESIRILEGQK